MIFSFVAKTLQFFILAPPRIQLDPGPTLVKTGLTVRLAKCYVTGFPTPDVTWRRVKGVLPGNRVVLNKGTLSLIAAEKNDAGIYECTARNRLGHESSLTSLFVWSPPSFVTKPPSKVNKVTGEELTLRCSASDRASLSWKRVGGAWEGERMNDRNGTLTITSLKKSDSGSYVCEAKLPLNNIDATTVLRVTGQ